ncbi:hypothetical protein MNBD_DELTA02-219 [hydrothermal vent metagenome]|uniref:LexA repressor DNA-binding domain-containing protein n=1 Tax=hydrothermal vent metagenome TaxID=652676 RepID=A0A3B0VQ43_9ZZZZ
MKKLIKSIGETLRGRISAAGLSREEEKVRKFILRTFAATGRPPTHVEIQEDLKLSSPDAARRAVKRLEDADLLATVGGEVVSSYPFSVRGTRHKVVFSNGREVNAMCATDALGISFMLKEDTVVFSLCPQCEAKIKIAIKNGAVVYKNPVDIIEWITSKAYAGRIADVCCPFMNFFCSVSCLEGWRDKDLEHTQGELYTVEEAAEHGRWIFEDYLSGRK